MKKFLQWLTTFKFKSKKPPEGVILAIGNVSIKSKGNCSFTVEDGKFIVHADNPEITAPKGTNIEVRPAKK